MDIENDRRIIQKSSLSEKNDLSYTPICDKFQPTVMEGQLCYSLDLNNVTRAKPKAGREMGLKLLLDRIYPRSLQNENGVEHSFRIFLNTLDGFSDMKDGSYRMINVKKMVGTDSFMAMPDEDKGCQDETLQACSARHFLERIKKSCSCVPWALKNVLKVGLSHCSMLANALLMANLHAGCQYLILHTQWSSLCC